MENNMKLLIIFIGIVLSIVSCKDIDTHYKYVEEIIKYPSSFDSICKKYGYIYQSKNKEQFIRTISKIKNYEYERYKEKNIRIDGIIKNVQIIVISVDDHSDYIEFYFVKNQDNWELITDLPFY